MHKITDIYNVGNFTLRLTFSDGETKTIDFKPLIGKGISTPLLDTACFDQVAIDNGGGLEWPNGMDFCPNFLRDYSLQADAVEFTLVS
jgi:hypothetical protein